MLGASEGVETVSETNHIHRSRCASHWKGQIKSSHRYWQSKSNSTTRSEVRLIEASMTLSADQNRSPPTFGGIPSAAFQVAQLASTQMKYLPSQGPNITANARDDYFIRSSSPKLKLAEFPGDPLEWPEWSQLFQATVLAANIDDSVKMNHLKTMVRGIAKEAVAGLGYTAEMYNVAWNVLVRNFGKPQMV